MLTKNNLGLFILFLLTIACGAPKNKIDTQAAAQTDSLPLPHATKSVMNFSSVIGWKDGLTPTAPEGFTVTKYTDGFENPRWLYVTPNGDVLVAESNSNHTFLEKVGGRIVGHPSPIA